VQIIIYGPFFWGEKTLKNWFKLSNAQSKS